MGWNPLAKVANWVGDRVGNGPSVSGLKSSIRGTGNLAAKVAPVVAYANPLLGAALSVGGNLAGGRNIGESVVSGAKTYGGAKLLQGAGKLAGKIPGVDKIPGIHTVFNPNAPDLPGLMTFDAAGNIVSGGSGGGGLGSTILGGLKSAGKFALDNPDLIGGAVAGYNGFKAGQQSDDLRQQAIRAMSERPDLSSIFADPGNPYNRYAQKPKATGRLAA